MIEQQLLDGRLATITYLMDNFSPAEADDATLVKVVFEDEAGGVLWLTPAVEAQDGVDDGATEPRTLYVRRDLINTKEFFAWAKEQGFTDLVDDPHVTVLYSKESVDWIAMGNDREFLREGDDATDNMLIPAGGPRVIMPLGDMGAVVLCFASSRLSYRHQDMIYKGASHDYDDYSPHVTISYESMGLDLSKVEPYTGPLVFGPEIFQEISLEPRN